MPQIKSAKKRLRTSAKAQESNMAVRTRVRTGRRELMKAVEEKDVENGRKALQSYSSILDRAVKKGVVKKNTAIRRKTRAANAIRGLGNPSA